MRNKQIYQLAFAKCDCEGNIQNDVIGYNERGRNLPHMISSWCLGPEGYEEFSSTCDDLEEKIPANWGLQMPRP